MATSGVTANLTINIGPLAAGLQSAVKAAAEFEAEQVRARQIFVGRPKLWVVPPTRAGKTARQYRAARRRYARTIKAVRRNR